MAKLEKHYHELLGLTTGWQVMSVDLSLELMRVEIEVVWDGPRVVSCPECGKAVPLYDLREERRWRHLDVMQFETILRCRVPRCQCAEHGVQTVATPWAGKHGRFTLLFERFAILVLQACENLTAACGILGISWHQLHAIRQRAVARGLERRGNEPIAYLGLDEKSFGRGHSYGTVLTDLQRGRVWEVRRNRDQEAVRAVLAALSAEQIKEVMAVAMDMWPAYMNVTAQQLPEAVVVHDKFHVHKHLNEAVDHVRKRENKALCKEQDTRLVGSKYLFLKRLENLGEEALLRFEQLRGSKLKVSRAWAIKELFAEFWTFEFGKDAREFFADWYAWAIRSRLEPIRKVAKRLKKHLAGLLGYIIHPITNAVSEGLNSKIQQIKASARGYRNFENYRIAILFHCGKLDMLPGPFGFPQNT
jgi:transposase